MSSLLFRFGRTAALHPWRTLAGWLVAVVALFVLAGTVGGTTQDDWDVPGTESQHGLNLLREHLPNSGNATANVVLHDDQRIPVATLTALAARLAVVPHAAHVDPPRLSDDGKTAVLHLAYDAAVTHPDLMGNIKPLDKAVQPARDAGIQVEFGGDQPATAAAPIKGHGELIGVGAALLILMLAFGSVVAAGLPIVVALGGLAAGSAGVTLLAAVTDVSTSAPIVASMVGLGVGIDYSLLMVSRFTENLRAGHAIPDATGMTLATAGRSVVFASLTVLVSLLGLGLAGLATYKSFGMATGIAVVAAMVSALTLVPVLSRFAGTRLQPRRERRGAAPAGRALTMRWAQRVSRRPLVWVLAGTTVLLALAAPLVDMRTWPQDDSTQTSEATNRRAFDLIAAEFGPGANGPVTIVAQRAAITDGAVTSFATRVAGDDDVARVSPVVHSSDGAISMFTVEPRFTPADERTGGFIAHLRDVAPDGVIVTGWSALLSDISDELAVRLWLVIGFVVTVSVLLLMVIFRSILIPLKAAAMNLLSIGAAYGVITAVFQWGWGAGLIGLDHATPVSSWVPILIFAILFGLSMDYEVFLLSRIREDWLRTGDAHGSVVRGLGDTGKVITCAAAIMVAVFLGFASEGDVVVKMLGVGMATAILVDATVVRMVLVPATMTLLGRWNWWLPAWLDRLLPEFDVEGSAVLPVPSTTIDADVDEEKAASDDGDDRVPVLVG
ncbi:MAG TPA: MMPL family transporter [Gordonia sp. (in: high G+C Gram-positive bacteria)]|uniref:MMPL family transporter n=1 Tax=unclassified Gordonia (in: high G+C Gram-positive bacteria) TaxID=2657482 RepID=UPI000FA24D6B|nr:MULTISPECIES: MMPL family transporter [unclassified Gordonia (in: high G+C Gram-positive bacteria)]RUP40272.1 MAG: MMPL family transporter [Gordonia sp. (in: high G+C Gram-positive bacteria)]HNP58448.1 MMPL family transporter [Gordonia sp. (in: high G+C Gram-positive bacteria)]HRC52026.1 MMPL family transporter [Gordonia sp. (in: high G+C Gram-positive bacteria)]